MDRGVFWRISRKQGSETISMMHPVYSFVPQRSYRAYVKSDPPTLSIDELLCALIVDPLAAEDAAEQLGVKHTPHALSDFADIGIAQHRVALETIAQWVRQMVWPPKTLAQIAAYNQRLGTWCACQIARDVIPFIGDERRRSLCQKAVEATEKWIVLPESASEAKVARSSLVRATSANQQYVDESVGAMDEACAGFLAVDAVLRFVGKTVRVEEGMSGVVFDATAAVAYASGARNANAISEARDLQMIVVGDIIAQSCLSFPVLS